MRRASLASTSALIAVILAVACGGGRVGDEGYFTGDPLPPPEPPKKKKSSVADASASATAPPSAAPSPTGEAECGAAPPARGYPMCDPDQKNVPCIAGAIGGCLLRCAPCASQPCSDVGTKPWPCPTPAATVP